MEYRRHILVVRLSALGDVAILQPVLKCRAEQNRDVLFTVAAPGVLAPLFDGAENIKFVSVSKKQSAWAIFKRLSLIGPTAVADMHGVNKILWSDVLFILKGVRVCIINKDKWKRRRILRKKNKDLRPLKPSWKRYDEVFDRLGLKGRCDMGDLLQKKERTEDIIRVGVAPFAQHQGKVWPLEKMKTLIRMLSEAGDVEVSLFGGKEDAVILDSWASQYDRVTSKAGKGDFAEELKILGNQDVIVSMDSANMHFASCLGVPVVSIWGATHPMAGFYGWRQREEWAVQSSVPCRPCSMFGNKPCRRGDYKCLQDVTVDRVLTRINELVRKNQ